MNKSIIYLGYNNFLKHKRGVENVIELQGLASRNNFNYYIHWDFKNNVYKYKNFVCIGIKKNFIWGLFLNLILKRVMKNRSNFLIHSHNPLMSTFSIYNTDIFTVHDSVYYLNKSYRKNFLLAYFLLEKITYFKARYVHFISNYSKKHSLFSQQSNNFKIIHNSSHFESVSNEFTLKKANLLNNKIKILVVRSIEDRARIDLIIELAKQLNPKSYEIIVAGKGPKLETFKKTVIEHELLNIQFLGYVEDNALLTLYNQCDIVLLTCEFGEGFGLPIIEAYMFNKPVLASNRCAVPEIIASNDFVFENNITSLKKLVLNLDSLPKIDFKNFYEINYSNELIKKQFNELYFKLFNSI